MWKMPSQDAAPGHEGGAVAWSSEQKRPSPPGHPRPPTQLSACRLGMGRNFSPPLRRFTHSGCVDLFEGTPQTGRFPFGSQVESPFLSTMVLFKNRRFLVTKIRIWKWGR